MAIETVDLPSYKMVDLSIVFCMFTRVILGEWELSTQVQAAQRSDVFAVPAAPNSRIPDEKGACFSPHGIVFMGFI